MAYRSKQFHTSRGDHETTTIVALRNGVDLRRLDNVFLRVKGDSVSFDCNVLKCTRYSSVRHLLESLEYQGVISLKFEYKDGYAPKRPKKIKKNKAKILAEEIARAVQNTVLSSSSDLKDTSSSSSIESSVSSESEEYCLCFTSDPSSSSESEEYCLCFTSDPSSRDSLKEKFGTLVKEAKEESFDIEAVCREKICTQLLNIPGVSERIVRSIFDLNQWNRITVDDIPYMRSSNVSRVMQILTPYKKVFDK